MGKAVFDQLVSASALREQSVDSFEVFWWRTGPQCFSGQCIVQRINVSLFKLEIFLRIKKNMVHFHFFHGME